MKQNIHYIIISIVAVVFAYLGYDLLKPYLYPFESIFSRPLHRLAAI